MKKSLPFLAIAGLTLSMLLMAAPVRAPITRYYGNIILSGGFQTGHFSDVWDLTAGDIVISFTYDANGLVDDLGGNAHAWAELGVRSLGSRADFNPYWRYRWTYPEQRVDLIAARHYDVGDVIVWGDGSYLYIKYFITEDCCVLEETHLAVATTPEGIPQKRGNPIPGRFEFKMEHIPPVKEYTYVIDLNRWTPSTLLFLAAHAEVMCPCYGRESAWGDGYEFAGSNWATYFTYAAVEVKEAGSGVWLATDYDWSVNTFDPDPPGYPCLDLDDKLILQRRGGEGEGSYNLPSPPPNPWANHRVWWDRDGVDPWQNPETANTGGIYQVIITLHATSNTTGTAYMLSLIHISEPTRPY